MNKNHYKIKQIILKQLFNKKIMKLLFLKIQINYKCLVNRKILNKYKNNMKIKSIT